MPALLNQKLPSPFLASKKADTNLLRDAVFDSSSLFPKLGAPRVENWKGQHLDLQTGKGLSFDGVADHIVVEDSFSLRTTGSITVGCWFKCSTPAASAEIISKWDYGINKREWRLDVSTSGTVRFILSTTGIDVFVFETSENFYTNDLWHHAIGCFDSVAGTVSIYIDGKLVHFSPSGISFIYSSDQELMIGALEANGVSNNFFPGELAGVFFYHGVVSSRDVLNAYVRRCLPHENKESLLQDEDLRGYWPMTEGFVDSSFTAIFDHSIYANHGTNVNAGATPISGEDIIPQLSDIGFTPVYNGDATDTFSNTASELWTGNLNQNWAVGGVFCTNDVTNPQPHLTLFIDINNFIEISFDTNGYLKVEVTIGGSIRTFTTTFLGFQIEANKVYRWGVSHFAASKTFECFLNGIIDSIYQDYTFSLPTENLSEVHVLAPLCVGLWDEIIIFDQAIDFTIADLHQNIAVTDPRTGPLAVNLKHYWRNGITNISGTEILDLVGNCDLVIGGSPSILFLQKSKQLGRNALGGHITREIGASIPDLGRFRLFGGFNVFNPDLDNGALNWIVIGGCGGSVGDGFASIANLTQAGACQLIYQLAKGLTFGSYYLCRLVVDEFSATSGNVRGWFDGAANSPVITAPGVYEWIVEYTGLSTLVEARCENAVGLSTRISHLSCRELLLPDLFNGGGTFSCWFKRDVHEGAIASAVFASYETGLSLGIKLGCSALTSGLCKIELQQKRAGSNGSWTTTNNVISAGEWYHLIVIYDDDSLANNPAFYINGVPYGIGSGLTEVSTPTGAVVSDAANVKYIGNTGVDNRTFMGDIADIAAWDYVLSFAEILEIFASQRYKYGV